MCNVAITEKLIKRSAIVCFACIMYSCGGNNENAQGLYDNAQAMYDSGKYEQSVLLLDSLKNNYPEDIDLLKKGLHLRTLNQEGIIKNEIRLNDSLISTLEEENKQFSGNFKYIKTPDMVEGYYIHNSIAGEVGKTDRVAVEPRIDENDMFYIVSYLTGHDVKHTSISLTAKSGKSVTSAEIPYDEAKNYRYKSGGVSYEIVTFGNNECDTLGYFAANNAGTPLKVTFRGKKTYSIQLNPTHVKAIADTYRYAANKKNGKAALIKRKYLESKLQVAQKQIEQTKLNE